MTFLHVSQTLQTPLYLWASWNASTPSNAVREHFAAVQSNMVYQPREVILVSTSIAVRLINANR